MRRRNVRQLTFRPPLPRRAIVWFPAFKDPLIQQRIQQFRSNHDPHAAAIAAHVSIVFPFHANLTVAQLASHIKHAAAGWPALPATFRGVETVQGEFVLLMCDLRRDAITELHDRLYRGVLQTFLRDDIVYQPHITIGRGRPASEFEQKRAEAELYFRDTYPATLRELSIVTFNDDGTIDVNKTVSISALAAANLCTDAR